MRSDEALPLPSLRQEGRGAGEALRVLPASLVLRQHASIRLAQTDTAPMTTALARRGTSNSNQRGSSEDRRRRREWLVETYRSDEDVTSKDGFFTQPACRCYRCGELLTTETVTVDRIVPGCQGGTYRRNNIRPACAGCNSETGGALATRKKRGTK